MDAPKTPFQIVLDALLATGGDFSRRHLQQFSDIAPPELQALLDVWPRVDLRRKLTLLEGLKTLADTDTLIAFDDVARALLADPDALVRTNAIRLLAECDDAKLIPVYLNMLKNDPDVNVRAEAATALHLFVDLGELEEISEEAYRQIEDALLETANSEDETRVRRHALESLGYSSRPEVVTLIESAFQREDPHWKTSAVIAMGRSADDHWDDNVLLALLSENDKVRKAAVQTAGMLSLRSARTILLQMLAEEDNDEVVSAAIWSLSQIGGEDVRTILENLLDETEDDDQIGFLEEALDNLAFTEDLDRFELMSFDPDEADEFEEEDK